MSGPAPVEATPASHERAAATGAPRSRGAIWLRRFTWTCVALVGLGLFAWLGLPALLMWQLPPRLSAALGRTVTIGNLGFRPWNLDVTVDEVAIAGPPGASLPLLQVKRIHANLSASSLFRRAPIVEALELDAPVLNVARTGEGHYDFDDVLERVVPKTDSKEPARFALYNVQVRDARVRFDDRPVGRVQSVEALQLSVPFISNLPAEVDIKIEPRLAFRLNGTPFDSGAQATPFALNKSGDMKVTLNGLDLAPFIPYLPTALPARLTRGTVSADVRLRFAMPQGGSPSLSLQGTVDAKDIALADADGQPLLETQRLQLGLRDVQPLAHRLAFDALRVDGLTLHATRDAAGRINLMRLAMAKAGVAAIEGVDRASASKASAAASTPASASTSTSASESAATSTAAAASTSASASAAQGAPASSAAAASLAASSATAARRAPPAAAAWHVSLESITLADGAVSWTDDAVAPATRYRMDGIAVAVKPVTWPIERPLDVDASGTLRTTTSNAAPIAAFTLAGPVTDHDAKLAVKVTDLSLAGFAPYLAQVLVPSIEGRLAAQATVDWSGRVDAPRLVVAIDSATLDGLKLREGNGRTAHDALTLTQLELGDVQVDALARTAALGKVRVTQPVIDVTRDRDGHLNVERWSVTSGSVQAAAETTPHPASSSDAPKGKTAPRRHASASLRGTDAGRADAKGRDAISREHVGPTPTPAARGTGGAAAPWRVQVKDLRLERGEVAFADASLPQRAQDPLRIALADLRLVAQSLDWQGDRFGAPSNIEMSARVGAPVRGRGRLAGVLDYKGRVGLQPLLANGRIRIERFPVSLFEPYFGTLLPVALLRGEAGYTGSVAIRQEPAGLDVAAAGDLLLGGVHVATLPSAAARASAENTDELLSWQSLALKKLAVEMKPKGRPQITIGDAALDDFYARLVVTEQGRLNLQDAVGKPVSAADAASAPTARDAAPVAAASAPKAAASAVAASGLPIDLRSGPIQLRNGRVDFTDHFIRPNYSAALTELNGQLGAFDSTRQGMATLVLKGRAEGTALLEISGQINPTTNPLALDIRAKATDLELAPLSPYAGKYAGYAIERGKLSMDVSYKIDPDGKLEAKNQVILNQLTFGDRIESKDATKLPVRLAVALLKDRNGVIDINLPVSGSGLELEHRGLLAGGRLQALGVGHSLGRGIDQAVCVRSPRNVFVELNDG
ncbi:MAG: DUF748 domain-containing protein, partial [Caldimonas sp.]